MVYGQSIIMCKNSEKRLKIQLMISIYYLSNLVVPLKLASENRGCTSIKPNK